jgi:single-strand DNA-binding protein
MSEITLKGRVLFVGVTESVGTNNFQKRTIAVEIGDQYPQQIGVEFVKEGCLKLDGVTIGDTVEIKANLRGREYQGKYYTSLQGWYLRKENAGTQPAPAQSHSMPTYTPPPAADGDGLPF